MHINDAIGIADDSGHNRNVGLCHFDVSIRPVTMVDRRLGHNGTSKSRVQNWSRVLERQSRVFESTNGRTSWKSQWTVVDLHHVLSIVLSPDFRQTLRKVRYIRSRVFETALLVDLATDVSIRK